jgi:hypothetical protein
MTRMNDFIDCSACRKRNLKSAEACPDCGQLRVLCVESETQQSHRELGQLSLNFCLFIICLVFGIWNLKDGVAERLAGVDRVPIIFHFEISDLSLFVTGMILIVLALAHLIQIYKGGV